MLEKKIDIYSDEFSRTDVNNAQLVCEFSNAYAIVSVVNAGDKKITAYEYFEFDIANEQWNNIFSELKNSSQILTNNYKTVALFYNLPEVLVAPSAYDNAENAKIYLDTLYGGLKNNVVEIERLSILDNVSVIYSVEENLMHAIQNHVGQATVHHSYSKLLQNISKANSGNAQSNLHILFYNQMFVLVLIQNSQLKFIKSVNYKSVDDMLYYILNVAKQHNIVTEQLQLKVSGFVNTDSTELIVLQKYFSNIVIEESAVAASSKGLFNGFPKQYFTPFFYLLA